MKKRAFVVENNGNMSHVLVYRSEACGSCSKCGACSVKPHEQWMKNSLDAKPGDVVELEMQDKDYYFSIFKLYVMPLILFLAGVFIVYSLTKQMGEKGQALAFLGGLIGLLIFFIFSRFFDKRSSKEVIKMVSIFSSSEEESL